MKMPGCRGFYPQFTEEDTEAHESRVTVQSTKAAGSLGTGMLSLQTWCPKAHVAAEDAFLSSLEASMDHAIQGRGWLGASEGPA